MSCWVAPTIAAELWGVPVDHVLRMIEAGEVETLDERGWTFVNVAPASPTIDPTLHYEKRPLTYTPISDQEMAALSDDAPVTVSETPEPEALDKEDDETGDPEPDQEESKFKNWQNARGRTSRLRLAPPKFQTI